MKISFGKLSLPAKGDLVVVATDGGRLAPTAQDLDVAASGALTRAAKAEGFTGKEGQSLTLLAPAGLGLDRLVLLGLGAVAEIDAKTLQNAGGRAAVAVKGSRYKTAALALDTLDGLDIEPAEAAAQIAMGAKLRSYTFDKYRSKDEDDKGAGKLTTLKVLSDAPVKVAKAAFDPFDRVVAGVVMTRNLVSEPANVIYPETLAEKAKSLKDLGVDVKVLGEKEMAKLGMGALLGVGQGSIRDSKLVVMQWRGVAKTKTTPVAFVGKGVTFDTGGISIKPAGGMEDMKWDMGGAGVVIGLMKALAGRKAKVNAVGIVGLVENMPSGAAQRPGDIVTSMSGKTIEVLNTDAEGRLVLADALWYAQENFHPEVIIDLATLTGAILVSLGTERAGLFTNDDALAAQLFDSGETVGEKVWRLPIDDAYDKLIKSDAADMKNIGGRYGGSITAAKFLQRFVQDGVKWAHLDIAGMTWSKESKPVCPKGGTGFGVRLLDDYVRAVHEDG